MVLELRPSHDPTRTFGFVGVVVSLKDLSASIWLWKRDNGSWSATKVIEIPAEPADPDLLPPLLKGFKAVPPLVTDINLSLDDKWLYVSCWGTGEFRRYDVSVPDRPKLASVIQIGGIVRKASHPKEPKPLSEADRKWSKSAETVNGSISLTRSMHPGTSNFIRTASVLGLCRRRQSRMDR